MKNRESIQKTKTILYNIFSIFLIKLSVNHSHKNFIRIDFSYPIKKINKFYI